MNHSLFILAAAMAVLACRCAADTIPQAQAEDPELELQLAAQSARVTTRSGRTFEGTLDGYRDERLRLRLASDGGEVVYSIPRDDIETFEIPGDDMYALGLEALERNDLPSALPLFVAVGRQRARYLPILNEDQRAPVATLILASEKAGDPAAVIGYARLLEPFATGIEETRIVRDSTLQAYADLGMDAEVRERAESWCATAALPPRSALGWVLLARVHLSHGDLDRARWTALEPIVFSAFTSIPHLDEAYAIAVTACHQLGDTREALTLFLELRQRGLDWPDDPAFTEIGNLYRASLGAEAPAPNLPPAPPAPPDQRAGPALTIDDVRRLVGYRQP